MAQEAKTCGTCGSKIPAFVKKCRKCESDKIRGRKAGTIPNKAKGG